MTTRTTSINLAIQLAGLLLASVAGAQSFSIPWHTVDGGGHMASTGGVFSLGGSIGQPDAGLFAPPMSGGAFELVGGFWPVAAPACTCLADMNGDGQRNGRDIQQFVGCIVGGGGSCACADINGGGLTTSDVSAFVQSLLTGANCP